VPSTKQVAKPKVRKQRKKTNKEWEEFAEMLCARCLVAGGRITERQIKTMSVKELFDTLLPNGILLTSTNRE